MADEIKKLGFIPALWIGATNDPTENEFIQQHPETVLVQKPQWCGQYFMDLTHPLYLEQFLPRVFRPDRGLGLPGAQVGLHADADPAQRPVP